MNFYLLSIIAFGVFVAILYLKSSEHQRMLYSQKYVRDKVSTVATPIQQLKAFQKVLIKPGESQCVELSLPIAELALYNAKMEEVVEPGDFEIQIGAASDDIRFKKTITIN